MQPQACCRDQSSGSGAGPAEPALESRSFDTLRRTFVHDQMASGRRFRVLNVVDAMTRISAVRGAPRAVRVDNGPEFISKALDRWAY